MGAHSTARRLSAGLAVLLVFAGAGLREIQALFRWDEIALAYVAYQEPSARALAEGRLGDLLGTWVGLHPPLYGVVAALWEWIFPAPLVLISLSVGFSLAAVIVLARRVDGVAAAVLAVSPLQVAYCAELNNYPLALLWLTLGVVGRKGAWWVLALCTVLAGWSHLLAGLACLGLVAGRLLSEGDWPTRLRLSAAVLLGLLPIGVGALGLLGQDTTWSQPDVDWARWGDGILERAGPGAGLLLVLALPGMDLALGAGLLVLGAGYLGLVAAGAAASHQFPYLVFFGPFVAVGVAQALARTPDRPRLALRLAVLGLCLVAAGGQLPEMVQRYQSGTGQARAIDKALEASEAGDSLWLVAPALKDDDDKTDVSPVLWRLSPWLPMPIARPVVFEYKDWRYGQPRTWRERTVHTSTELDHGAFDHVVGAVLARGRAVYVVLYEHGPATGLEQRVERALRPYQISVQVFPERDGLGGDRLYKIKGLLASGTMP